MERTMQCTAAAATARYHHRGTPKIRGPGALGALLAWTVPDSKAHFQK
jgi:hypothetical protein